MFQELKSLRSSKTGTKSESLVAILFKLFSESSRKYDTGISNTEAISFNFSNEGLLLPFSMSDKKDTDI